MHMAMCSLECDSFPKIRFLSQYDALLTAIYHIVINGNPFIMILIILPNPKQTDVHCSSIGCNSILLKAN